MNSLYLLHTKHNGLQLRITFVKVSSTDKSHLPMVAVMNEAFSYQKTGFLFQITLIKSIILQPKSSRKILATNAKNK